MAGRPGKAAAESTLVSSSERREDQVDSDARPAANVVPFVQPADKHQARYYKAVLDEQRAAVAAQIAELTAALSQCEESRDRRGMRQLEQRIAEKQDEEYDLDCLRDAVDRRFFPWLAVRPAQRFDIEVNRRGNSWRIRISGIDEWITARRRQGAEMLARKHIAVVTGTPIAGVAVQVVTPSPAAVRVQSCQ
jgi:hypothetical protein